jgi:hypothetical protein
MADVDINEALDKSLETIRDQLEGKATVKKQYHTVPAIKCEEEDLIRILATVLTKLAEAVEESGQITTSTWDDEANVYVGIRLSGASVSEADFPDTNEFREIVARRGENERIVHGSILMRGDQIGAIKLDSREGEAVMFKLEFPLETLSAAEEDQKRA